ncbi:hypothetical protein [Cryptosporangium minutisporangium]|uniref:Thioesterase family protein n=1 Tax=Cryptosporangium minutisporangium TaxID=113569 RepID=A0ABP6T462_9ACTN
MTAVRPLRAVADPPRAAAGGVAADAWLSPGVDQLLRSLNLWRVGTDHFLAMAADPDWPAFPAAQLVAALVTAAERSVPECRVRLVSWSPGALPSARRSVRIVVDAVHRGPSGDVTAQLTVDQRDSARGPRRRHGHAIVLLTPDVPAAADVVGVASGRAGDRPAASVAVRPAARFAVRPAVPIGAREVGASGLVPPDLPTMLAAGALGDRLSVDPTTGRALLAYFGAALTVPADSRGQRATVVASTVAFLAPAGHGTGLTLGRVGTGGGELPAEGHAHAMTEFRTPAGVPVVQTSQAVILSR